MHVFLFIVNGDKVDQLNRLPWPKITTQIIWICICISIYMYIHLSHIFTCPELFKTLSIFVEGCRHAAQSRSTRFIALYTLPFVYLSMHLINIYIQLWTHVFVPLCLCACACVCVCACHTIYAINLW